MTIDASVSLASDALPVLVGLYCYRRLEPVMKLVACFLFVSAFTDWLCATLLNLKLLHNNNFITHLYIVISLVILGQVYYKAFFIPLIKKVILILSVIGLLIMVYNIIFIEGIMVYPSISNTVLSVLMILFSLLYFYQLLNRQEFIHIENQPLFWVNASVLFYYSLTVFLFMLYRKLTMQELGVYYMINSYTNVIANVLFTIGLLCKPQKTT